MKNDKNVARKRALKEFAIGAAVAAVGGIISVISYNTAASNPRGGTYTVYYGLIVVGAVYAIKGLYGLIFPLGLKGDNNTPTTTAPKDAETVVEAEITEDNDEA